MPVLAAVFLLAACGAPPPEELGPTAAGLRPCPPAPNCIHTGHEHPEEVQPFLLTDEWLDRPDEEVWDAVESAVLSLRGSEITTRTDVYLHVEATSALLRFIDDLEIYREPGGSELVVRSESRVGRSDMGVNMRRVEALRQELQEEGVVRQGR